MEQPQPSIRDFLTNFDVDLPLPRKLWLLGRNLGLRLARRQNCCGHPGEPGC